MEREHYHTTVPAGGHWSFRIRRGLKLRFIDVHGGGNCALLFYNPENLLERYNAPDSLKCQHTFRLTRGNCLYSDMGRIFCSIVDDDVGWHETVSGTANRETTEQRFGALSYQQAHNERHQNGYDAFLIELATYGLGPRDMAANLNLFAKVVVDENGTLTYVENNSAPGDSVTLRFEMDTVVVLHTCPHPLAPAGEYPRRPIDIQILDAEPVAEDDYCRNWCEENQRGFRNNALYYLGA